MSRCDVWGLILYKHVVVDDDVPSSFEVEHESIVKCQQIESCQNIVQTERSGAKQSRDRRRLSMAQQTSLFKVFSVGQITSIKCCPHAAQLSRRRKKKRKERRGEGEGEGEGEEQKLNHAEIAEFGRGFLNALSLTPSVTLVRPTLSQYNNTWAG